MINDIYNYLCEKFNIKITEQDYKFKRDYIKEPLKKVNGKWERPFKNDWIKLYIDYNLSFSLLSQLFNINQGNFNSWNKEFNIHKSKESIKKASVQTSYLKYGVSNPAKSNEYKKLHSLIMKSQEVQKKKEQTNLTKYGVKHVSQSSIFEIKKEQTNLNKYGVNHVSQLKTNITKMKETNKKRYGVEYVLQNKQIMNKKNKTLNVKYGVTTPLLVPKFQQKSYNTRKQNNTFTKSKPEDLIYNNLCTRFDKVLRQYRSDLYPFPCDFYIPEIDTYIEYNGYWSHGKEPYDSTNEQHINKIKLWESKSKELNFKGQPKKQYLYAINVWTISDPKKRQIAKQNGLNWFEFFNLQQFEQWFKQKAQL